ncbi:MAG: DUF6775 family putative metallopeptidase, partial [Nitrosopumilaceae archaeon]|nr:DUF6775 family putative metallopeptidase [Nitrosopumilaceae archaeon]
MKISKIILYDEPAVPEIQLEKLSEFLKKEFSVQVELRDSIFMNISDEIAHALA